MDRKRTRVLWTEGLLLSPQHFQQQDRWHEEWSVDLYRHARPFGFGFRALRLDPESIRNGRVAILEARGILPDGTPFSIPDRDAAPTARTVEGRLAPNAARLVCYLALRAHRPGEREVADPGVEESDRRYRETTIPAVDRYGEAEEREVLGAVQNLRILFPDEEIGDYQTLPLAEVVRRPEGGFGYQDDFVPPCLALAASEAVTGAVRRLVEILVAKSTELSDRRRVSGRGAAEFGRDDTAGFWLLGTVNAAIPVLAHHLRVGELHPELLYRELARLAGTLTTLSETSVRDLPLYDHVAPASSLLDLARRIPQLLEISLPRNYTRIPLSPRDTYVQSGRIPDDRLLDPAYSFFLGVHAGRPGVEIQEEFPLVAKMASLDRIDFLVAHALSGASLRFTQNLPSALPVQGGFVYFQLDRTGDAWDGIAGSRTVAVYVPPEFPGARLELIAVRD